MKNSVHHFKTLSYQNALKSVENKTNLYKLGIIQSLWKWYSWYVVLCGFLFQYFLGDTIKFWKRNTLQRGNY